MLKNKWGPGYSANLERKIVYLFFQGFEVLGVVTLAVFLIFAPRLGPTGLN